jgi:predicted O-methyltransferase YrrM
MRPEEAVQVKERVRELVKRVPVIGKPYVQRDSLRAVVNQLWEPPGHFYSPIPSVEEIRRHADRVFSTASREIAGVDLHEAEQLTLLSKMETFYQDQPFADDPQPGLRYSFTNAAFTYFDAIVFHGMLRHSRPQRVIEAGSGYSSCVLLDTSERFLGNTIACTFIEPYPQLLESLLKEEDRQRSDLSIIRHNLQDVDLDTFETLTAGDILFIDSTHVSKTDSDVNYIFFEILPRLRSGVVVHFHDIFYPFEYPKEWVYQGRAWNEAYTLRAFLQYNDRFRILLFNSFLETFHRDRIAASMPLCTRFSSLNMVPTSAQSIWLMKQ